MRRVALVLAVGLLAGCVFRAAAAPRYFRPESTALASAAAAETGAWTTSIHLREVRARPFLRERIVWRTPVEYGMYEQRRWNELPEAYAERALVSALRQSASIGLTDDTRVPTLTVDVTAFDEVLAPEHVANVALDVSLTAAKGRRLLERTFSAETAVADDDPRSLAHAVGAALDDVSMQVAQAIAASMREGIRQRSPGHRRRAGTRD